MNTIAREWTSSQTRPTVIYVSKGVYGTRKSWEVGVDVHVLH